MTGVSSAVAPGFFQTPASLSLHADVQSAEGLCMEEFGASARGCRKTTRILAIPCGPLQASSVCLTMRSLAEMPSPGSESSS